MHVILLYVEDCLIPLDRRLWEHGRAEVRLPGVLVLAGHHQNQKYRLLLLLLIPCVYLTCYLVRNIVCFKSSDR